MLGQLEGGIAEKGTDGGEPQTAAACPDSPLRLQIIEKGTDQRRIERFPIELGRCLAEVGACKMEQEAEGVAVGEDRMGARLPLLHQTLSEEAGQQGGEDGIRLHDVCPQWRSSRPLAAFSISG